MSGAADKLWRYAGCACPLDLMDEATARRVEQAAARVRAAEEAAAGEAGAARIAGFCDRLRGYFDEVFGPGMGARLVGEANHMEAALLCYADYLAYGEAQKRAVVAAFEAAVARYDVERLPEDAR